MRARDREAADGEGWVVCASGDVWNKRNREEKEEELASCKLQGSRLK